MVSLIRASFLYAPHVLAGAGSSIIQNRQLEAGGDQAAGADAVQAQPTLADGPRSISSGSLRMTIELASC
jgi:hypothetical protein